MVQNHVHTEFLPIEERIRRAGAEQSVEMGYRIGDALARLSHRVSSLFARRETQSAKLHQHLAAGD